MKIVRIECFPIGVPLRFPIRLPNVNITQLNTVLVKIHADCGTVGIAESGDTSSWYRGESQASICATICDVFARQILLGEDPRNLEKIVGAMDVISRENFQAKALVDCALHDLLGKAQGVPVYQLLGGRTRESVPLGWVLSAGEPDDVAQRARRAVDNGFVQLKVKVGRHTYDRDVASVAAVRAEVGDAIRVVLDANGSWHYETALKMLRRLDPYGLDFVEQPVPYNDLEGMARLRNKVGTPIYADEAVQEPQDLLRVVKAGAADGVILKLQKMGGLTKARKFLAVAEMLDIPILSSSLVGSTFEAAPSAHLMVSNRWASNFITESTGPLVVHGTMNSSEISPDTDLATEIPLFESGVTAPLDKPGFGLELNEAVFERCRGSEPARVARMPV
ncbi:MAG: enolase C-terminal domain-like protein [Pusillimonas sp.]